jgi:V/A-type H+-transporting ATPase subunit C
MMGELRRYAAANARARTLLASLLGRSGLEMLYGYPNAEALLDALARTPYAALGADTRLSERTLSYRLAVVGRAVLGLLADPERSFLRHYLLCSEVANLKTVIRALHAGLARSAIAPHLVPLPGIATVAAEALAEARNLPELVDLLAQSPYGPALRGALHAVDRAGPFALEVALELDFYERLWARTDTLRAADAARARAILGIQFDLLNLMWIARYRDALNLSPEEILNYTLRQGRWITMELRRGLAENARVPWAVLLERTPYGALLEESETLGFDACIPRLWRFLALETRRTLASYPFHIGIPLSLLLAQEIEIRDLRVLLAAKSLGVPAADALEHVASVRP